MEPLYLNTIQYRAVDLLFKEGIELPQLKTPYSITCCVFLSNQHFDIKLKADIAEPTYFFPALSSAVILKYI